MKRLKTFRKRVLPFILALSMILQQSGFVVLASSDEQIVQEVEEQEAPAKEEKAAPAPETSAPETQAPETQAPETQAPETQAPETQAPETQAPETSAPETQAPETEAQETTVPETEIQETSSPETDVIIESTETEMITETETETETEAPVKTKFRYEDSRVIITARASKKAALPEDAEIKADYLVPGSAQYNAAVAALNAQLDRLTDYSEDEVEQDYVLYDIYFLSATEGRIEPEHGKVKVEMTFKSAQTTDIEGEIVDQEVVHLKNNGVAEVVTDFINTNGDGEVTSMGFSTTSFSTFGARFTVRTFSLDDEADMGTTRAAGEEFDDAFIDSVFFTDNQFRITFSEKPDGGLYFPLGTTMTYELPSYIVPNPVINAPFKSGNTVIGSYTIQQGALTITIDKTAYEQLVDIEHGGYLKNGFIEFEGHYDESKDTEGHVSSGSGSSEGEPEASVKNPKLYTNKYSSFDASEGTMTYTITARASEGDFKEISVKDSMSDDQTLVGQYHINIKNDNGTVSKDEDVASLFGQSWDLKENDTLTITYKAKVAGKINPDVKNEAEIKIGDEIRNDVVVGNLKTDDTNNGKFWYSTVEKGGNNHAEPEHPIWTVTVAKGYAHLSGATVTDTLQNEDDSKQEYDTENPLVITIKDWSNNYQEVGKVTVPMSAVVSGESWAYTFSNTLTLDNGQTIDLTDEKYYAEFTYYTNITKSKPIGTTTHKNSAGISGNGTSGTANGSVGTTGATPNIAKTGALKTENPQKADWKIIVSVPAGDTDIALAVKDTLESGDQKDSVKKDTAIGHWGDTVIGGESGIKVEIISDDPAISGQATHVQYTPPEHTWGDFYNAAQFKIFFNADNESASAVKTTDKPYNIVISYSTDIDPNISTGEKLENKAEITGVVNLDAKASVFKQSSVLSVRKSLEDSNVSYQGKLGSRYEILIAGVDPSQRTLTITDDFSDSKGMLELLTVPESEGGPWASLQLNIRQGTEWTEGKNYTDNVAIDLSQIDNGKVTFNITVPTEDELGFNPADATYWFYYYLFPTDETIRTYGESFTWTGTNTATVTSGSRTELSNVVTGTFKTPDIISKKADADGKYNNLTKVKYTIRLSGADLNPSGDTIKIEDQLGLGLTYIDGQGTYVVDNVWQPVTITPSNENGKLVFELPDNAPLTLTYYATVASGVAVATNSAKIVGIQNTTETSEFKVSQSNDEGIEVGVYTNVLEVEKKWEEADDHAGINSVEVELYASYFDGTEVVTKPAYQVCSRFSEADGIKTLNDSNQWKGKWESLQQVKYIKVNGVNQRATITYSVVEKPITGYKAEYAFDTTKTPPVITVTNKKTEPEYGSLTISKSVSGNSQPTANTTYNIVVTASNTAADLSGVTATASTGTVSAVPSGNKVTFSISKDQSVTLSNLPVGDYTVVETTGANDSFTVAYTGLTNGKVNVTTDGATVTVTNTYPDYVTKTVTKNWNDNNNQDGLRPTKIDVQLLADGSNYGTTVELNANNGWSYTWNNLPKANNGTDIVYSVKEITEVTGYTTTYSADKFTITNTHNAEKITVSGIKTWNDANDQDGVRPDSITINLLANGVKKDSKTVTADNNWSWTFADLDKKANGVDIVYTITEDAVAGYTAEVNGYNVTNTHTTEKVTVSGSKTWNDANDQDGKRPTSITINLLADGTKVDSKTVTAAENWSWNFADLAKKANGKDIVYTITEDAVEGYTSKVEGYNVTNSYTPGKANVSGTKTWNDANDQDGKRPERITINLFADGTKVDSKTVTAAENWNWSFEDLAKKANGKDIVYTITEDAVEGYTSKVEGYNVTNSYTPEKTSVSGTKTWNDANDQDGKRPESITINLFADGTKVDSKTVTAAENWSWSFENLAKKANGKDIVYTITEDAVEGYTSKVEGYNVTNSYTPGKTSVSGTKTWNDANDQDGKRPASITINLFADGTKVDSKTVTAAENWSWTFADLAKKANGKDIVYTITEDAVEGYTSKVESYNVANTHTTEKTSVSGTKTWNDANNQDGKRPTSITINLLADGRKVDSKTVTAAESWSWTFADLDKKANGKDIVYTITEDAVVGYTTEVNGYDVTNNRNTGVDKDGTSLTLKKTDGNGTVLKGAEFKLTSGTTTVATATTDANGIAVLTIDKTYLGTDTVERTFTLTETKAPTGYKVAGPWTVKVVTAGTRTESTDAQATTVYQWKVDSVGDLVEADGAYGVANTLKTGTIKVTKELEGLADTVNTVDATFTFTLTKEGESEAAANLTVKAGETKEVTLPLGTYVVEETTHSDFKGYNYAGVTFDPTSKKVNLTEDGQVITVKATNKYTKKTGDDSEGTSLKLKKTGDNGIALKGAAFALFAGESQISTAESGEDGIAVLDISKDYLGANKTAKTFTLKETKAPEGYKAAGPWTVTVESAGTKEEEINDVTVTIYTWKVKEVAGLNADGGIYNVSDESIKVTISKTDIGGTEIAGAELKITDKSGNLVTNGDGEVVQPWTSVAGKSHVISALKDGEYVLTETSAPQGYVVAESIGFTIKDGKVVGTNDNKVTMKDDYNEFTFSKQDVGGDEIADAVLKLTDKDGNEVKDVAGNVVEQWTTDGEKPHVIKGLVDGTYKLVEITQPDGYVKAEEITFVIKDGKVEGTDGNAVTMVDAYSKVTISKTDISGTKEIGGAVLKITDEKGNAVTDVTGKPVGQWTSEEGKSHVIEGLKDGKYVLVEETRPDGYVKAESITFEIKDGKVVDSKEAKDGTVKMVDAYSKVTISKTDITGKNEIADAVLKITDEKGDAVTDVTGNTVDQWTSEEGKSHEIEGLKDGKYVLVEETRPDGYVKAESITFEIKDGKVVESNNAKNGTVKMVDDYSKVTISKTDITGKNEIANAELKITDVNGREVKDINGNVVAAWTTDGETKHEITGLKDGAYMLTETTAPNGYQVAESIVFEIKDGKVTGHADGVVTMKDDYSKVIISKEDIAGKEVANAKLKITDEKGNAVTDVTGKTVAEWTTDGKTKHEIAGLLDGTYKLVETKAPDGYKVAEEVTFVIENGKVKDSKDGIVTMIDNNSDVVISKTDVGGKEIAGATLKITDVNGKEVTDKDGKVIEEWTTDGVTRHDIKGLKDGTYKLVEITAPDGYVKAESVEFVIEDGKVKGSKDDIVKMVDDYSKVTISKTDITGSKEIANASLKITDEDGDAVYDVTGKKVAPWTTDGVTKHEILGLKDGTYKLVEITAPEGYEVAEEITFVIKDGKVVDSKDGIVTMKDDYNKVSISKEDIDGKEIAGATLKITDVNGNAVKDVTGKTVEQWTSVAGEKHVIEGLLDGTYKLVEITQPDGYVKAEEVTFVIENSKVKNSKDNVVTMIDDYSKVSISKEDIAGKEIAGAELKITDADGKLVKDVTGKEVAPWTSEAGKKHEITGLVDGTYKLVETTQPDGYVKAEEVTFVIKDGKVVDSEDGTVTMVDDYSKVTISKTEITGSKEIADAVLKITDEKGNAVKDVTGKTVEQWTTDGKTKHEIEGLLDGTYKLVEITAPDGYAVAEEITFVIENGKVKDSKDGIVTMKDDYNKVIISKTDIAGEEIADAVLKITDEKGNAVTNIKGEEIKEWTTDGKTRHEIEGLKDGTYKLVETTAPNGYAIAEEITFVIENGKVKNSKDNVVTMVDSNSDVVISKTDIGGKEIAGAVLKITDLEGKAVTDRDGKEIKEWTTDGKTKHEIEGLLDGTYKLVEITQPDGYVKAEEVTFVIENGKVKDSANGIVTMVDDYSKVVISKTDIGGKEIADAVLRITDEEGNQVTDVNGNVIKDIKTDGVNKHEIEGLKDGKYQLTEITAPDGYVKAETITFEIKDGKVVGHDDDTVTMVDDYSKVIISKTDIAGKEIPDAVLRITDEEGNKVTDVNGKVIEDIKTDGVNKHEIEGLKDGKYQLTEITAPDGYVKAETITFEIKDGKVVGHDDDTVTMVDDYSKVVISKTDIAGKEIADAVLKITDEEGNQVTDVNGNVIEDIKTDGVNKHEISGLKDGKYVLVEETRPDGYVKAESITFEIKDGKVVDHDDNTVTMVDDYSKVVISKTDIAGKEIPDAVLRITDEEGNKVTDVTGKVIEDIKTDGVNKHEIDGLKDGKYQLKEITAPDGYVKAETITFEIKDGKVVGHDDDTVTMVDDYSKVIISKTDITGEEIPDAVLRITDKDGNPVKDVNGNVIEDIKTDGIHKHEIEGLKDGDYKLVEITAPDGYEVAEEIEFTIKDGKVVDHDDDTITMIDDYTKFPLKLSGTKRFADQKAGQFKFVLVETDKNGNVLPGGYTETATNAADGSIVFKDIIYTIKDLDVTHYYKISEVNGGEYKDFILYDDIVYTVEATLVRVGDEYDITTDISSYSELYGEETDLFDDEIDFNNIPARDMKTGKLEITKKVVGADGKAKKVNATFFAGIFTDAACTKLAPLDIVDSNVVELKLNNASEVSETIGVVLINKQPVTLYVKEVTDATGKTLAANSSTFAYTVSQNSTQVIVKDKAVAKVTITNKEKPGKPNTPGKPGTPSKTTSNVKTGDNTPIAGLMATLFAAITCMSGAVIYKKRRRG